jgi:hypothetical protein
MADEPDPLAELRKQLSDLTTIVSGLVDSRPEPSSSPAGTTVDLDALAKDTGLSRSAIEKAVGEARKQEERERLRPILEELLDELLPADPAAGDGGAEGAAADPPSQAANGTAVPAAAVPAAPKVVKEPKVEDTGPFSSHWSDKPLAELFR